MGRWYPQGGVRRCMVTLPGCPAARLPGRPAGLPGGPCRLAVLVRTALVATAAGSVAGGAVSGPRRGAWPATRTGGARRVNSTPDYCHLSTTL